MNKLLVLLLAGVFSLGLNSVSYAEIFNASDGGWSITVDTQQQIRNGEGTPTEGLVNWNNPLGYDYVYQDSWWGRDSSASSENPLSSLYLLSGSNPAHNKILLNFKDNNSLYLDLSYELNSFDSFSSVLETGVLTNKGTDPLNLSIFKYVDYDLAYNYSAHDDDTALGDTAGIMQYDAFDFMTMIPVSPAPDAFQISIASGPGSIISSLKDGSVTNFTNTEEFLGPADISFGYQWNFTLNPNQPYTIENMKTLVTTTPEPVSTALFLLGGAMLALKRTRGRKSYHKLITIAVLSIKIITMRIVCYVLYAIFFLIIYAVNANAAYKIGNTDVSIRAGLRERYDDNITYVDSDEKKDFSTDLSLGFDVKHEAKLRSLRLNGNVSREMFSKYSSYDNTSEDFSAEFFNEFSKYQRVSLKDTFLHAYEPRSFEDEFGRVSGRYSYYKNKFNCAYKHDITKQFNAGLGYANEVDHFSRSDLSDSYMNKAVLSAEYALSSAALVESAYSFEARDFDPGSNAYTNTLSLGLRQYFTKQVYIDALAGVDFISSYDNTDYTKPLFNVMLTDEPNETQRARLGFNKQYYVNAYSDNVFDYWKVSGELIHQIIERLAVSGAGFYGKGKYLQSDITDDLTGGNVNFIYDIRDNIKASIAYNYSRTASNIESREYTKNNIDFNIRIVF